MMRKYFFILSLLFSSTTLAQGDSLSSDEKSISLIYSVPFFKKGMIYNAHQEPAFLGSDQLSRGIGVAYSLKKKRVIHDFFGQGGWSNNITYDYYGFKDIKYRYTSLGYRYMGSFELFSGLTRGNFLIGSSSVASYASQKYYRSTSDGLPPYSSKTNIETRTFSLMEQLSLGLSLKVSRVKLTMLLNTNIFGLSIHEQDYSFFSQDWNDNITTNQSNSGGFTFLHPGNLYLEKLFHSFELRLGFDIVKNAHIEAWKKYKDQSASTKSVYASGATGFYINEELVGLEAIEGDNADAQLIGALPKRGYFGAGFSLGRDKLMHDFYLNSEIIRTENQYSSGPIRYNSFGFGYNISVNFMQRYMKNPFGFVIGGGIRNTITNYHYNSYDENVYLSDIDTTGTRDVYRKVSNFTSLLQFTTGMRFDIWKLRIRPLFHFNLAGWSYFDSNHNSVYYDSNSEQKIGESADHEFGYKFFKPSELLGQAFLHSFELRVGYVF